MSSLDNIINSEFNRPTTIEEVKTKLKTMARHEDSTWNLSIAHLLTVLGMASSQTTRHALAIELGYSLPGHTEFTAEWNTGFIAFIIEKLAKGSPPPTPVIQQPKPKEKNIMSKKTFVHVTNQDGQKIHTWAQLDRWFKDTKKTPEDICTADQYDLLQVEEKNGQLVVKISNGGDFYHVKLHPKYDDKEGTHQHGWICLKHNNDVFGKLETYELQASPAPVSPKPWP